MNLPLVAIVLLIIQIFTYQYLVKLNECFCVQSLHKTEMANLQHLQYVMLFFIAVNAMGIVTSFISGRNSISTWMVYGTGLYFILLAIVYITLILHTYRLYQNMPETCECAVKWPRYYLYFLALLSILALPGTIITLVGIGLMIMQGSTKSVVEEVKRRAKNKLSKK